MGPAHLDSSVHRLHVVLALLTRKWIFGASWATYLIVGIKMYGATAWRRAIGAIFPPCSARNKKVGASPRPRAHPHKRKQMATSPSACGWPYFVTRNRCSHVDF